MHKSKLWIVLATMLIASCTLSQRDPTGFIPLRKAPTAGFTKVSEYFGVEVTGGTFSARKISFFHIGDEQNAKELIGSDLFPVYASRQGAYAVSDDGKVLIFMHNESLNTSHLRKNTGLYEYVHGGGARALNPSARSGIYINDTLPENSIVFKRKDCPQEYCFDSPIVVRNTDGVEYVRDRPNPAVKRDAPKAARPLP